MKQVFLKIWIDLLTMLFTCLFISPSKAAHGRKKCSLAKFSLNSIFALTSLQIALSLQKQLASYKMSPPPWRFVYDRYHRIVESGLVVCFIEPKKKLLFQINISTLKWPRYLFGDCKKNGFVPHHTWIKATLKQPS